MSKDSESSSSSSNDSQVPTPTAATQGVQPVLPFVRKNADSIYKKLAQYPPGACIPVSKDFGGQQMQVQHAKQKDKPRTPRGNHQGKTNIKTIDPNTMFYILPDGKQAFAVPNLKAPGANGPLYYENKVEQLHQAGHHEMVKWEETSVTPQGQQYQYYYDNRQQLPGGGAQHQHQEVTKVVMTPPPPPPPSPPIAVHYQMENYAWNMAAANYNQANLRAIQQNLQHQRRPVQQPRSPQPKRAKEPAALAPPTVYAQMEAIRRQLEEMNRWVAGPKGGSKQKR